MPKYFIIAGEASGDLHASNLVRELKKTDPSVVFTGIGGNRMKEQGVNIVFDSGKIAFMGFAEVFLHLPVIFKALRLCKKELLDFQPDAVILVDYPGFNMKIASFAKKHHFKVIYYILPQIWAWKVRRVFKLKKLVDLLICILPFEPDFYAKFNVKAFYCGHPLVSLVSEFQPDICFTERYKDKKVVAVLPGSRKQEVSEILPVLYPVFRLFPAYHFVIAATSNLSPSCYQLPEDIPNAEVVFDKSYDILHLAEAGIITSGTATLETALFNVPMMVCYKTSGLTYYISKQLIKVKYISLVNLINQEQTVKELIQHNFNPEEIKNELEKLLFDEKYRNEMKMAFQKLRDSLGSGSASQKAAAIISGSFHD